MPSITGLRRLLPLLFAPALFAEAVAKDAPTAMRQEPSKWSTEARLLVRFDPVRMQERERLAESGSTRPTRVAPDDATDRTFRMTIDGRTHPELLLPHEVFNGLISGLHPDPTMRAKQQAYFAPLLAGQGVNPVEFWEQLAQVAAPFIAAKYGNAPQPEVCRSRYEALMASRALYGAARFDEILYEVVAPSLRLSENASSASALHTRLRSAERGCR
jgi:hypothetical protein